MKGCYPHIRALASALSPVGTSKYDDFPVTTNAYQRQYGGSPSEQPARTGDGFFAKFDAAGKPQYISYFRTSESETGSSAALDTKGRLYFLKGTAAFVPCRPSTYVIVVDTATGQVIDREGVANLNASNATLAIDGSGVIQCIGSTMLPGDPLAVTDHSLSSANVLLARIDFTRNFDDGCRALLRARRCGALPCSFSPAVWIRTSSVISKAASGDVLTR